MPLPHSLRCTSAYLFRYRQLGTLKANVEQTNLIFDNKITMSPEQIGNYLRSHRRTSGLSQHELAQIVGYLTRFQVARHEQSASIPALIIAVSYEVIFRVSISELFPGLYQTVEAQIERELGKMEEELQESTAKGHKAAVIARKLEWLWERRNPQNQLTH